MVTCLLIFPGHVWALWHLQKSAKEDNNMLFEYLGLMIICMIIKIITFELINIFIPLINYLRLIPSNDSSWEILTL